MTEYIFENEKGQEIKKNFDNIVQAEKFAEDLENAQNQKITIGISAAGFDPEFCAMFSR